MKRRDLIAGAALGSLAGPALAQPIQNRVLKFVPQANLTSLDPIWFGVLIAMNLQTSFLTPPLGPTLFYLQSVLPPDITSRDVYRGVIPFVILQLIGILLVVMFPAIATWLPDVLF